ncbi:hypothetical protein TSOC_007879 [Tetrabaena socialis]|uniref:RING-CH-type domain-containing protein n=1 Tax=Tetrabaena socialis TaxID=47790 RepID=A0A2J7ZZW8_9CHLO|nr:hypothetical protein TSOC_007879 [Tetrabaena socialis]|eukprot:PNH05813.1 hypothetical protein TSOC_007879 [Tetrabaena socialis]
MATCSRECWICLDDTQGELKKPCACPRYAHLACLGRWQEFPSWVSSLTPRHLASFTASVQPWMSVVCGDQVHKIPVRPGPEGEAEFSARVKALFNFPPDSDFEVAFECKGPINDERLLLRGIQCFDAATHCAAITAAKSTLGGEGALPGI